jgi:excisionase family DNA binding protein
MQKTFIKVREANKLYGIGIHTLRNAIKSKELKSYRPNRRDYLIKVTELEEWIQSKPT